MKSARLRPWLELFRLPNVFTAMADIFLGFLLTHQDLQPWWIFLTLLAASSLIYTAGMVLNDVFDILKDLDERPYRPLPSGRIRLRHALRVGGALLIAGVALGSLASALAGDVRSAIVATLLGAAVVLYDRTLKRTPLAPVAMGACRMLNVLLGASVAAGPWQSVHWIVAGGIGLYIVGVTWFARSEARTSPRVQLLAATIVMASAFALLATIPHWADAESDPVSFPQAAIDLGLRWYVLWGALGVLTLRRCVSAVMNPIPQRVQAAVKECILSLVIIDAAACFSARGLVWAVVILLLLVPTIFLGRWIYST